VTTNPNMLRAIGLTLEEIVGAAVRICDVVRRLDQNEDQLVSYWGHTMMVDVHRGEDG
jgi:hypothetical protein